jgi:hypothetical protein
LDSAAIRRLRPNLALAGRSRCGFCARVAIRLTAESRTGRISTVRQVPITCLEGQIVAADFFVVPTATYRLLFVLVLLAHDRRRIRHVAVTTHPTAAWTAQQLREAFPWDQAPRYLLHDRDHALDSLQATAKAMGIEEVLTAPRALAKSIRRAIRGFRPS